MSSSLQHKCINIKISSYCSITMKMIKYALREWETRALKSNV